MMFPRETGIRFHARKSPKCGNRSPTCLPRVSKRGVGGRVLLIVRVWGLQKARSRPEFVLQGQVAQIDQVFVAPEVAVGRQLVRIAPAVVLPTTLVDQREDRGTKQSKSSRLRGSPVESN